MNRIGPQLDAKRPHVLAFGGGKGGVGRSTLCSEVARSLARRDERVLCVDASWSCPALHTLLNVPEQRFPLHDESIAALGEDDSHVADFIEKTETDNIWLTSLAAGRRFPYFRPDLSPVGLIRQLHALDFDWVFIDLASGLDPFDLGLFALSDIPLMVTTPEPGAVRVATQFLRHALFQSVRYHPDAMELRDEIRDILYRQRLDLSVDRLIDDATSATTAELIEDSATRFEPYLAVNLVREGAEQDLGHVICHAWHQAVGIFPRFLTSIDYENRRWFYHRRTVGTSAVRSDEALSRDIESLAQMVLDISVVDAKFPRPLPRGDDLHPSLRLGISPDSSRNEVRQHCRRLWEGYKRERAVDAIFQDPDKRPDIAAELETLYRRVLTLPSDTFDSVGIDPSSETDVGLDASSSNPTDHPDASASLRARTAPPDYSGELPAHEENRPDNGDDSTARDGDEATDAPPSSSGGESEGEAGELPGVERLDETEPGELVESLRRRESISLQELSRRTHIGIKYLTAIEDGEIGVLPRPVYLRGYLREIARAFDVDPDALVREYVRLLDEDI